MYVDKKSLISDYPQFKFPLERRGEMEKQRTGYTDGAKYYRYEHNTRTSLEQNTFMVQSEIS